MDGENERSLWLSIIRLENSLFFINGGPRFNSVCIAIADIKHSLLNRCSKKKTLQSFLEILQSLIEVSLHSDKTHKGVREDIVDSLSWR